MTVTNGQKVCVHYRGTFEDGTEFDNSRIRKQPLEFTVGGDQMIAGFNNAIVGMDVGETKTFTLSSEEAYGPRNEEAIQQVPRNAFDPNFDFIVDEIIRGQTPDGPFVAKILSVRDDTVTLDFNHPLAGRDLTFEVEVVSTEPLMASWTPKMKKAELLEIAKSQGLNVNTRSTKAQIIQALSA
tara:strand:- start:5609 stop:6157 length:549 start_codon:yes stop_codon:yes gene_type:complete